MRLYEATGMGSLLLLIRKIIKKTFEEDREIVTINSKEEALDKYNYLINNPAELANIAKAGQLRTLKEHTYENRIKELIQILNKHI
jgi:Uncharacterized protein conserved in bacteria